MCELTLVRSCRGRNVKIMVPLFQDKNTDNTPEEGAGGTPGIYMDAMAFGMGCNCLQVTFQAQDVAESRHLWVSSPLSFVTLCVCSQPHHLSGLGMINLP